MSEEYKPINNLWKDFEGYRYFGTLKLSSKIKYDGDDFIPLWEWINQLQQENKILKENAEHNDKVVDKVNWENMLLKKENKQLKEELKAVRKGLNKVVSKRKKWKYRYDKEKMKNRRAKSYIKNNYHLNWYVESNYKDELLQILDKGESNE